MPDQTVNAPHPQPHHHHYRVFWVVSDHQCLCRVANRQPLPLAFGHYAGGKHGSQVEGRCCGRRSQDAPSGLCCWKLGDVASAKVEARCWHDRRKQHGWKHS